MTEHTEADALREEAATLRINEQVANAHLIAAAPDLLDALKQIVECEKRRAADLRHREAWKLVKFSEARIAQAEAAIAKATGVDAVGSQLERRVRPVVTGAR